MKRGIYLFPTIVTLGNLAAGVTSILFSTQEHFSSAAWCILAGIIMDMLDGRVARWTGATSQFGVELDSLCDLISFGVAPGILMYQVAMQPNWVLGGGMWAKMATNYFTNANAPSYLQKFFATDAGYIPVPQRQIGRRIAR